ncbi:JAB domain containing [Cryptosporidium xiaoi]|uniref:JAB domain containing n=1 Tax=Cryptosporidium xiaoi TaxID=659607 RepID=A0AAV9Y2G7_9CRYT
MNIEFSNASYIKIIMHSMKYSDSIIDGVLIGYLDVEFGKLVITDSFPFSHSPKLSEYITLGLGYIQEYCNIKNETSSDFKIGIVGYYHFGVGEGANINCSPQLPSTISERLIPSLQSPIVVTQRGGTRIQTSESLLVKFLNKKEEANYSFKNQNSLKIKLEERIKSLHYLKVVDMEDHFMNPNLDFINSEIGSN